MTQACMIVAHPDDDAVFGAFFQKTFNFDWHIIVCSGTAERMQELSCWQKNWADTYSFENLNFEDNPNDFDTKISSWDRDSLYKKLYTKLSDYDIILSHNVNGEYGHPHHKDVGFVVNIVCRVLHLPLYVFGYGLKDADIILRGDSISEKVRETYKSQAWVVDSFDPTIQTYKKVF